MSALVCRNMPLMCCVTMRPYLNYLFSYRENLDPKERRSVHAKYTHHTHFTHTTVHITDWEHIHYTLHTSHTLSRILLYTLQIENTSITHYTPHAVRILTSSLHWVITDKVRRRKIVKAKICTVYLYLLLIVLKWRLTDRISVFFTGFMWRVLSPGKRPFTCFLTIKHRNVIPEYWRMSWLHPAMFNVMSHSRVFPFQRRQEIMWFLYSCKHFKICKRLLLCSEERLFVLEICLVSW